MAFSVHPVRLRVMEGLTAVLKTISPVNGYAHDLTGEHAVLRGVNRIGDNDVDVLVAILEPPVAIEQIKSPKGADASAGEWDILIQGWCRHDLVEGFQNCDLTYFLANDVRKALLAERRRGSSSSSASKMTNDFFGVPSVVYEVNVGAPVVRPTDESAEYGVFYLLLNLKIVEDSEV